MHVCGRSLAAVLFAVLTSFVAVSAFPPKQPQASTTIEAKLQQLQAELLAMPVPTAWGRAHRLIVSNQPSDLELLRAKLRPPTGEVPIAHFFDSADDEENARADKSEVHDGQLALALVLRRPSERTSGLVLGTSPLAIVGAERGRHQYRSHIETLEAFLGNPVPAPLDRRAEMIWRRSIANAELSWFYEAVAHEFAERRSRLLVWVDRDGCRISLTSLADLQRRLAKHVMEHGDTPLAERGIHAVGAFVRVAHMAGALPAEWSEIARTRPEATQMARRLLYQYARSSETDEIAMEAAHVLELVACRGVAFDLGLTPRRGSSAEAARDLELLTRVVLKATEHVEGFAFKVHAAHALQLLVRLNRARAGTPLEEFRACATI